jgi:thiamine biosynthesis protein ThiS
MPDVVRVTVNGESRTVPRGATLLAVLRTLELDPRTVVVEHNRQIVRRPALDAVAVAPGDAIELVHFVGGG